MLDCATSLLFQQYLSYVAFSS